MKMHFDFFCTCDILPTTIFNLLKTMRLLLLCEQIFDFLTGAHFGSFKEFIRKLVDAFLDFVILIFPA